MALPRFKDRKLGLEKVLILYIVVTFKLSHSFHRKIWNSGIKTNHNFDLFVNQNETKVFTINTTGCTIPKMDITDQYVAKYVQYPWGLSLCPHNRNPLLRRNQSHIWVNKELLKYYRVLNGSAFECCYKPFHWQKPLESVSTQNSWNQVVYGNCTIFNNDVKVTEEFVVVECYYNSQTIYKQFYVFVPKKPFLVHQEQPFQINDDKPAYNVIIIGLSSMSRINAHRTMPNSFNLLEELGAVELFGYHAVAGNTFENIIPVLTGMTSHELKQTCWPGTYTMFNNCPFIWERFKDSGYYTAFVEDTTTSGIFSSESFGFRSSPTDYYLRSFIHESENSAKFNHKTTTKKIKTLTKKIHVKPPKSLCMGDKYYFRVILEYVEQLTAVLESTRLFGFFWESTLGYGLNAPFLMDHDFETLLRRLVNTGYLNRTILIVLGDHGMSRGGVRYTKQGQLERRLPLVSILLPPAFRERYSVAYKNLKTNANRLTTPLDLHATFIDLVDLNAVEDDYINLRSQTELNSKRGTSLFLEIPSNRTCKNTNISNDWCTCHVSRKLKKKSKLIADAMTFISKHLNAVLKPYPQCARLMVDKVIKFEEMWPSYGIQMEWREFKGKIRLKPVSGEYEVFLRYDNVGWSLLAHIRRLYPDTVTAHCINHDQLKQYCSCQ